MNTSYKKSSSKKSNLKKSKVLIISLLVPTSRIRLLSIILRTYMVHHTFTLYLYSRNSCFFSRERQTCFGCKTNAKNAHNMRKARHTYHEEKKMPRIKQVECENTTKEKTVRLCNRDLWFQFLEDLKVEKSIKTSEHDLGQVWTE